MKLLSVVDRYYVTMLCVMCSYCITLSVVFRYYVTVLNVMFSSSFHFGVCIASVLYVGILWLFLFSGGNNFATFSSYGF